MYRVQQDPRASIYDFYELFSFLVIILHVFYCIQTVFSQTTMKMTDVSLWGPKRPQEYLLG